LREKDNYSISCDKSTLDFDVIHRFISEESYWGKGRRREVMEIAIANSTICYGVYLTDDCSSRQIGFARVLSDLATFGYICDVFILPEHRGKGLGKWLVETIVANPQLKNLRRITLFTQTPDFYNDTGFVILDQTTSLSKFLVRSSSA